jgi:hypothetical protein
MKHLKPAMTSATLHSGDGNGTFGGMEERIAKLELIAEDTRSTLNTIMGQLGRMDAKLDSKPDQGWIINLVCVIFGLVLAAIAATAGVVALIR